MSAPGYRGCVARQSRRRKAIALIGAAVVVLGVTAVVGPSLTRDSEAVPLTAKIDRRYRFDEASGVLPILLRNNAVEPVTVTRLTLVAPSVVTASLTDPITVRPGWTRRVRVPLRPARCPHGAPSSGPAAVTARVVTADMPAQEVRVRAADPERLLDRLARADCDVQRVLRVADVALGETWRRADGPDPALRGEFVVTRRADRPAMTVTGFRGSIIVRLDPGPAPPWRLPAGGRRLAVPVEATVSRCDRHALMESKKTLEFSAWVELAGEDDQRLTVRPGPPLADLFYELITDACRHGAR